MKVAIGLAGLLCALDGRGNINHFASAFTMRSSSTVRKNGRAQHSNTSLKISNAQASDLLYQEQENLIISRGELEEKLMSESPTAPLAPSKVKVRGAGKAGGFGGGSSSKPSTSALKAEAKAHGKVLKKDGVVRIDSVLPGKVADSVREYVYSLRSKSEEEVEAGTLKPIQRFANVLLRKDRCDLTIPLGDDIITDALNEVLRKSAVGQTIMSTLGKDAVLYELSCLMSDPGSQRQVVHPDTPFLEGKGPVLYTCFIALQDVRLDMGPTTWLPGTHTAEAHDAFADKENRKDELLRTRPAVLGTLTKGSCAVYDSRILHCGTANRSEDNFSRALLYFSFKSPEVGYPGNPASIRSELGAAQVKIQDIEKDLESYSKGKGHPMIDRLAATIK